MVVFDEFVVQQGRRALEHKREGHFDETPPIDACDGVRQARRLAPDIVRYDDSLEQFARVSLLDLSQITSLPKIGPHKWARLAPEKRLDRQGDVVFILVMQQGMLHLQLELLLRLLLIMMMMMLVLVLMAV